MNLILFTEEEFSRPLPWDDPRAEHLLQILKRNPGESFDAGLINGPRGKAFIEERLPEGFRLRFVPGGAPPPLYPLILAVGAGRPQTAKKILRECTALGLSEIHFFASGKGEQAYLLSHIYQDKNYLPYLIQGAQQAFCTRLPEVAVHHSLGEVLRTLEKTGGAQLCLDNYEAEASLTAKLKSMSTENLQNLVLWIGPERGWSGRERKIFQDKGIPLLSMGPRVLRVETACITASSLCLAAAGFMD